LSSIKLFEKNAIIQGKVETEANTQRKDVFTGNIEEYRLGSEIGKGSFATVKQAVHKQTGEKFAIKVYDKNKLVDSARRGTVKREIQILKKLNSKYTIKLYEVIETTKYVN
jgi:serine/threonine protein kinase